MCHIIHCISFNTFVVLTGINLYDVTADELLMSGWNWSSPDSKFAATITAQEFYNKNFSGTSSRCLFQSVSVFPYFSFVSKTNLFSSFFLICLSAHRPVKYPQDLYKWRHLLITLFRRCGRSVETLVNSL